IAFRRCRQQDKSRARADMLLEVLTPRECPGALEHKFNAQLLPWEVRGIEVAQRTQLATGDNQIASVYHHGLRVPAVYRVETKQVGQVLDVDEVIDRDQLHRWLVDNHLQDRASYSPQAID